MLNPLLFDYFCKFLINLFMGKKKEYKEANRRFLKKLSFQEGVFALPCGIYYKVLETGEGTISPGARSIVTVHYKGSLIDGRVFDNSYERTCPDALRLSDVIEGWQVALQKMHVGDKWIIYIPYAMGLVLNLLILFLLTRH